MSGPRPVRLLVADDEALVRAGLIGILATDSGLEVVAEASSGLQVLEILEKQSVDVVISDIRMPGLDGLGMLRQLREAGRSTKCIFVTTFGEDTYVDEAAGLDADGFVLKAGDPRDLLFAVHAVAEGGVFFAPAITRRLLRRAEAAHAPRRVAARRLLECLSPRERSVVELLAQGRTNAEIANALHVSVGTVKTHISSILRATETRNRVEAALLVVYAGDSGTS